MLLLPVKILAIVTCKSPFLIQEFSRKQSIIFFHRKEKAQQLLNRFGNEETSKSGSSAEYAFDFLDSSSLFGSQLNLRTTSSEFDDLPGFVAGKLMYFIKGVAVQPFSVISNEMVYFVICF